MSKFIFVSSPGKKSTPSSPSLLTVAHDQMQCGRRTALPAVSRLSLTGFKTPQPLLAITNRSPPPPPPPANPPSQNLKTSPESLSTLDLKSFTKSKPGPGSRSRWRDRSLLRETPLFSVRVQVWAPGCSQALGSTSLLKPVAAAHASSCHADTIGQVSKGLMGFWRQGREGWGAPKWHSY